MLSPELATELRGARPSASPELHERVLAIAARQEPRRPPRFTLPPLRRMALVAAPIAVALGVGGALVHGLVQSGKGTHTAAPVASTDSGGSAVKGRHLASPPPRVVGRDQALTGKQPFSAALPNTTSRLAQYGAFMRLQVKNLDALSDTTKRAMRFARFVGGYVAYVRYSSPAHGQGSAALIVRVPIDRVQDVIGEYSDLGTILSQKISVVDVTKAVEEESREIMRLQALIARLQAGGVTPAERYRLSEAKARLDYLTKHKAATVRRAELARVRLELTTKPKHPAAAAGRFDRTMADAGGVLLREAEILFYALIVAGPLLLLGAGGALLVRTQRRRFERRLLERSI
jgi:Domain of unknown function (DUF4349)